MDLKRAFYTSIILTGTSIAEVSEQLRVLDSELVKWVESNGLALKFKKQNI